MLAIYLLFVLTHVNLKQFLPLFQDIPEPHKRCFTNVLQAASVTPEPIGKLFATFSL